MGSTVAERAERAYPTRTGPVPSPVPAPTAHRWRGSAATVVVSVVWTLMLIGVQPWSSSGTGTGGGTGGPNAGKGVLLVVCLVVALCAVRGGVRGRVPAMWWWYFAYLALAVLSTLLTGGEVSVAIRGARIALALVIPLCLWPLLRDRPERLVTGMLVGYSLLAVLTLLGPVLAPSHAWLLGTHFSAGGRLKGAFLGMLPPRVGEIGAITAGMSYLTWAHRRMPLRLSAPLIVVGIALIVLSRTRTAAAAALLGLLLAAFATYRSDAWRRQRNVLLGIAGAALALLPVVISWALRNQSDSQVTSLSGRTVAWDYIVHLKVDRVTWLFGHGLGQSEVFIRRGDNTLNYAPIDSSWLSLYYESGMAGAVLAGCGFLAAVWSAFAARTPYVRAVCVFIVTYAAVDSFNETGLSDVSSLVLMLLVAAFASSIDRTLWRYGRVRARADAGTNREAHPLQQDITYRRARKCLITLPMASTGMHGLGGPTS